MALSSHSQYSQGMPAPAQAADVPSTEPSCTAPADCMANDDRDATEPNVPDTASAAMSANTADTRSKPTCILIYVDESCGITTVCMVPVLHNVTCSTELN